MNLKFTPSFVKVFFFLCQRISPILLLALCTTCASSEKERSVDLPNGKRAIFLSENQAKIAIAKDEVAGYFDHITNTDIEIQTKIIIPDSAKRGKVIADFKSALQEDVQGFTREDKEFIVPILKDLGKRIGQVSKDFWTTGIKLIKIGGKHYGPSIFYTRENCIIIPKYELMKRDERMMKSILAHELFHIYSRYRPEKRSALYEMIGFKPLAIDFDQLEMPAVLKNSILLNPDGMDLLNYITLSSTEGEEVDCILLTSSEFHQYTSAQTGFFPHLSVNFYPVESKPDGTYRVRTAENGNSPLDFRALMPSLFDQIGSNTFYVIHPDEILADNFALLVTATPEEIQQAKEKDELQLLEKMSSIIDGQD